MSQYQVIHFYFYLSEEYLVVERVIDTLIDNIKVPEKRFVREP